MLVPEVRVFPARASGEWIDLEGPGSRRELPQDAHLHEFSDLDIEDPEAIAEFATAYGLPAHPGLRHLPRTIAGADRSALRASVEERISQRGRDWHRPDGIITPETWEHRGFLHANEVRIYALALRFGLRFWQHYTTPDLVPAPDPRELVVGDPERDLIAALIPDPAGALASYDQERDRLPRGLDLYISLHRSALSNATPYLVVETPDEEPISHPTHEFDTSAYNAMWVQIHNDMVRGGPYQVCENETCDHLFLRQRGRADYGQHHSTGVLYCSDSCARAQAQRRYRRRKKAQREEEE